MVTLHEVKQEMLPDLDDDFAKFLHAFEIVTSHSIGSAREIIPKLGMHWSGLKEYTNLRSLYYNVGDERTAGALRGRL